MKRIIIFITMLSILSSCQSSRIKENSNNHKTTIILEKNQQILKGEITRKQFTNKGGHKVTDAYDYFFEWKNNRRFVKTVKGAGGMTKDELAPFLKQKVDVVVLLTEGSWDTDPSLDFPVQSRGGEYVIIYKVLEAV